MCILLCLLILLTVGIIVQFNYVWPKSIYSIQILKAYHCTFSHHVRNVAHDPESHVEDSKPYPVLSNYWSFFLCPFCKGLLLLSSVDVYRSGQKAHLNKKHNLIVLKGIDTLGLTGTVFTQVVRKIQIGKYRFSDDHDAKIRTCFVSCIWNG